ncbi:MAG TPA: hypothetical protein VKG05_11430 [Steroidobacteraceae bacterium]|nr:hypothetical protein [Steroidobacteraceae bacterium]
MPRVLPIAAAVPRLSPVSITILSPMAYKACRASAADGLSGSAKNFALQPAQQK